MRITRNTNSLEVDNDLLELVEVLYQSPNNYSSEETLLLLKECIDQLKIAYTDIIIAVDFEVYTDMEIAKETGISIGTLMSRRHRALRILYAMIEQKINR